MVTLKNFETNSDINDEMISGIVDDARDEIKKKNDGGGMKSDLEVEKRFLSILLRCLRICQDFEGDILKIKYGERDLNGSIVFQVDSLRVTAGEIRSILNDLDSDDILAFAPTQFSSLIISITIRNLFID